MTGSRSTEAVLQHHLQAFDQGIEAVMTDYIEDSVLMAPEGIHRGLKEIRQFFSGLIEGAPEGVWEAFDMKRLDVAGEFGYLLWEARPWFLLGTDTFVVRDGKIVFQSFADCRGSL